MATKVIFLLKKIVDVMIRSMKKKCIFTNIIFQKISSIIEKK
jgi:hypothetical protein